jgi:hypothetical protein
MKTSHASYPIDRSRLSLKRKRAAPFSLLFTLAGIVGAQDAQPKKPSLSLNISVPQDTVKAGSPVVLHLAMTNISDGDLNMSRAAINGVVPRQMDVKVFDKDGQPVPETDYGMRIHGRVRHGGVGIGVGTTENMKPGDVIREESDLSKEFELKPGKYTVQAECVDPAIKTAAKFEAPVKSNVVTFTVTP